MSDIASASVETWEGQTRIANPSQPRTYISFSGSAPISRGRQCVLVARFQLAVSLMGGTRKYKSTQPQKLWTDIPYRKDFEGSQPNRNFTSNDGVRSLRSVG